MWEENVLRFCSILCSSPEFDPEATIIIASSVGTQSQLKNALEAGAKDFIQKPLDKEQVLAVVKRFLEGR